MITRLSNATLSARPAEIQRPRYDRTWTRTGVVHLGIGAFHRAHQAVVFDDALRSGDLRWGVLGVSLRSRRVRDQLAPQDGLYSVIVRHGERDATRIIGAVSGVLVAPEDPAAVVAAMASPEVHIVCLTVTEKGYRLDPVSGALLSADPDVAADLADLSKPRTAPGFLVAALAERRRQGLAPFTVISCDNLPHNGARVRAAVLAMAEQVNPDLADWISTEGAFPQTMVDRIVPATVPQDIDALENRLGVRDEGMVRTEPFTQWVIEDRFCGPRPDFAALGVQLTDDVAPWEDAKLRLLNGAHSALAYLGGLAGHAHVHTVVGLPAFAAYVERLWDEAQTTLSPPPGLDLPAYRAALLSRFCNPALMHRTHQIAIDGSQKLPQRLLATIAARLDAGRSIDALALGVAGWMRWQAGRTDAGDTFTVDDPLSAETARRLAGIGDPGEAAEALMALETVFPRALAADDRFRQTIGAAAVSIATHGAQKSVERLLASEPACRP